MSTVAQTRLDVLPTEPPEHRVRALAGVLAGFRWPDRGSFEKLTKPQREAALDTARVALRLLGNVE